MNNKNFRKKIFYISSLASVGFVLNSPEALANDVEGLVSSSEPVSLQANSAPVSTSSGVAVAPMNVLNNPVTVPASYQVSVSSASVVAPVPQAVVTNTSQAISETSQVSASSASVATLPQKEVVTLSAPHVAETTQVQPKVEATTTAESSTAPVTTITSMKLSSTATAQSVESNNIINVQPLWESNVKGQGKVVAVIDTGLDVNHDVLKINEISSAKFKNAEDTEKAKTAAGITYGKWYNDKVIFGYNYADADEELKQKNSESHGMHVSGIAVGNPSQKHSSGNYIYGVAPEAQLMFMRVFSDKGAGGTSPYLYAKAIEDAIKLGADTINLSLGSANGVLNDTAKTIEAAINKANAAGITVVIAGGNDTAFGEGHAKPDADKPDYGLVGDPSVAKEGISVASFNNTHVINELLTIKGADDISVMFSRPSIELTTFDSTKEYEYVYAGKGTEAELKKLGDLSGKIALIQRGDITFGSKVKNAHQYNAAGVLIFNNTDGDAHSVRMTLKEEEAKIPSLFIDRSAGELLIEKEKLGKHTILIDGKHGLFTNPKANEMSDFSSWGLSADGELKPDLAAPGGDIFSSINDNRYTSMGGTSMATPHVAGVSVLMKQVLEEKYPEIKGKEQALLIKHLLMSTAVPHVNKETGAITSPRQQGAGIINVSKAISSDLYVTGDEGLSSVSLGNIGDTFTFNVTVHNLSNNDKNVKYFTEVNTDQVEAGKFTLKPRKLTEIVGGNLTVQANSSVTIPVTIDTTKFAQELTETMKNGYYLEGFVRFLDTVDEGELVSIPYVGFRGEYQNLDIIEKTVYDFKDGENPFYTDLSTVKSYTQEDSSNYTALILGEKDFNHITNEYTSTLGLTAGAFKDKDGNYVIRRNEDGSPIIAISPNGDGNRDALAFRGVFLRNYKDLRIAIYKDDDINFTNPLWIGEKASGDKNYYSGNPSNPKSNIIDESEWEGKDKNGKLLPDGKYKYVVEHYSVVPGAEKQRLVFDIVIDTAAPKVTTGIYDETNRTFRPRPVVEKGVGVYRQEMYYVVEKADSMWEVYDSFLVTDPTRKEYVKKNDDGSYTLPTKDIYERPISDENIWLVTEDLAGNTSRINLAEYKKIGNNSGIVNVRLMDNELKLPLTMLGYRYVIKDESGKVVSTHNTVSDSVVLPFGQYTVELILFDEEYAKLLDSKKVKEITVDENATEQIIDFDAKLVLYSTLTVDFNTELPEGIAVYAEDLNGKRTELTKGRYIKDIFEKRLVYNEKYRIVVETPKGYFVAANDISADMVEDHVIKVLSLWAKGDMSTGGVSLEREELREFNLLEDSDKDGFSNRVELENNSNPLDKKSVPNISQKGTSLVENELPQLPTPLITTKAEPLLQEEKKEAEVPVVTLKVEPLLQEEKKETEVPEVTSKVEPLLQEEKKEAEVPVVTSKVEPLLQEAKKEAEVPVVTSKVEPLLQEEKKEAEAPEVTSKVEPLLQEEKKEAEAPEVTSKVEPLLQEAKKEAEVPEVTSKVEPLLQEEKKEAEMPMVTSKVEPLLQEAKNEAEVPVVTSKGESLTQPVLEELKLPVVSKEDKVTSSQVVKEKVSTIKVGANVLPKTTAIKTTVNYVGLMLISIFTFLLVFTTRRTTHNR